MPETTHTPTPFHANPDNPLEVWSESNTLVAECDPYESSDAEAKVNAAFIVRACNSHAALVAACESALTGVLNPEHRRRIKNALALAKPD
jgi:hypothetical protein